MAATRAHDEQPRHFAVLLEQVVIADRHVGRHFAAHAEARLVFEHDLTGMRECQRAAVLGDEDAIERACRGFGIEVSPHRSVNRRARGVADDVQLAQRVVVARDDAPGVCVRARLAHHW